MNEATDSLQLGAYNIFCNMLSYFSNPDTPVLPLEIPFKGYKERHSSYLWCSPSRNIDCVFLNVITNTKRSEYNLFYTILDIFFALKLYYLQRKLWGVCFVLPCSLLRFFLVYFVIDSVFCMRVLIISTRRRGATFEKLRREEQRKDGAYLMMYSIGLSATRRFLGTERSSDTTICRTIFHIVPTRLGS